MTDPSPNLSPLADADPLCRMDAAQLRAGYAARRLSPVAVTRACLDRAEAVQARCNAFTLIDRPRALAAAALSEARWLAGQPLGPIDGIPTTIKDIVLAEGWTVRYGTTAHAGVTADRDAPAVELLRHAGAVLLGLTTTPEFGWKAVTDSALTGITRNPWDRSLTPGGSSGGAAVAAASGAGVLHLGTDGGGSIRIPAAFCGVVGHKPSFGRVPAHPASSFGTLAHLGPIARQAADAAAMLDVLSGRDGRDWFQSTMPPAAEPGLRDWGFLRIGVWRTPPGGTLDPAIAAGFAAAMARLTQAGAELVEIELPPGDLHAMFQTLWFAGAAARLRSVPAAAHERIDPGLREIAAIGAATSLADYLDAGAARAAFGTAMDALAGRFDLLVSPAVAVPAFAAGAEVPPGGTLRRWTEWAGFSYPVNLWQAPACVVPIRPGHSHSLQFLAPRGHDHRALHAAAAWQRLTGLRDAGLGSG